jgi:hypothetical protein
MTMSLKLYFEKTINKLEGIKVEKVKTHTWAFTITDTPYNHIL